MNLFDIIQTSKKIGYLAIVCIFMYGCRVEGAVYKLADINEFGWNKDSSKYIIIENNDTLTQCSISILMRFNPRLATQNNVNIAIEVQSPSSKIYRDTLYYQLSDKPTNNSASTFNEQKYQFIDNAVLHEHGKYVFKINHFDSAPICGIDAIGVIIDYK